MLFPVVLFPLFRPLIKDVPVLQIIQPIALPIFLQPTDFAFPPDPDRSASAPGPCLFFGIKETIRLTASGAFHPIDKDIHDEATKKIP